MGAGQTITGTLIGVISDTHGLVRPQAVEALAGVDMILHAGDIGNSAVLDSLRAIAPVVAVRGNNDKGEWAESLPDWEVVEIGAVSIYMLHDLKEIDINPAGTFQVVISGHSHKPAVEERRGVLYVNPGSAGPRRFTLPVSLAHLRVRGSEATAQLVELSI
ncbi:MAG TPA: metallophosphoesterase family protein [Pyrinomonadaceae bacterium]|nr:metallophosphoesterase family protein [Pyrinomonadaceae bacterium]